MAVSYGHFTLKKNDPTGILVRPLAGRKTFCDTETVAQIVDFSHFGVANGQNEKGKQCTR